MRERRGEVETGQLDGKLRAALSCFQSPHVFTQEHEFSIGRNANNLNFNVRVPPISGGPTYKL